MAIRPSAPPSALIFFTVVVSTALIAAEWEAISLPLWTAGVTFMTAALAALILRGSQRFRRHAIVAALSLLAAHTAIITTQISHPEHHPIATWLGEERHNAELELLVTDGPIFHDRGISFDARLVDVDIDDGTLTEEAPKVRVFYSTATLPTCSPLPLPGDRVTGWSRIERFTPAQVPWRLSQRRLMEGRGYAAKISVRDPLSFDDRPELTTSLQIRRALASHRLALEHRIGSHLEGDAQAIATAMLTGSRGTLTPEFREPFDITSTGHILAISGLHFAVIAALIALMVRLIMDRFPQVYRRIPRRVLIGVLTLALLLVYTVAIGAPVSARRAFGMTALAIGFICFSPWRLSPLSALAATAGVLLLLRPSFISEAGYQLSVSATAGILIFMRFRPAWLRGPDAVGPTTESKFRQWRRRVAIFAGLSISATVATWPVLLRMTGELPLAGLWANLIVVPLVSSLLFPLLVAGALLTSIWSTAAGFLLTAGTEGLLYIHSILDIAAYAPLATLRWGTPSALEFVGAFIACGIALVGGLRPRSVALACCAAALFALPGFAADRLTTPTTTIHFIYVGQGDATLIESSDGTTVLIDGGGRPVGADPGLRKVVPYLRHRGIRRLDAVVLSHGDYDHYGGLSAVIRPFRPEHFYVDADEDHENVDALRDEMASAGSTEHPVDSVEVIATEDVDFHIHRPDLPGADDNDRSLVLSFSYAGAGAVLPGDLESLGEEWLVDNLPGPRALVKVPHHGSNTSSSPDFLDHFSPAVAVASSGRHNRFGHPDPEVVSRYEERDIDLFRTDKNGAVVATIDARGVINLKTTR